MGLASSRGPYFMYFTVKIVSKRLQMMREMAEIVVAIFGSIFR